MAEGDPEHRIAKAVRAARAYAGMSRAQLGMKVGVTGATIGRYERGDWRSEPPRIALLEAIARATRVHAFADQIDLVFGDPDPAMRFADAARREAERQNAHPGSEREVPSDEDEADGAP